MTTSAMTIRGKLLELILNAYLNAEFRDVIKCSHLIASEGRVRLFRCIIKTILKHVKIQDTELWMKCLQIVWDLLKASVQKGQSELLHAAKIATSLYKDTNCIARSGTKTFRKTVMARKQLAEILRTNWAFVMDLLLKAPKNYLSWNSDDILESVCALIRYGVETTEDEVLALKMSEDLSQALKVRSETNLLWPFHGLLTAYRDNEKVRTICITVLVRYLVAINKIEDSDNMPLAINMEDVFALCQRVITSFPESEKVCFLCIQGTPNFVFYLCGVLCKLTHLREYFKEDPELLLTFCQKLVSEADRLNSRNQLQWESVRYVLACIGNLLLCMAFWCGDIHLIERVTPILTYMFLRPGRSFRPDDVLQAVFELTLFKQYNLPNLLNVPLCEGNYFHLPMEKRNEIIRGMLSAKTNQRLRWLLKKARAFFPSKPT